MDSGGRSGRERIERIGNLAPSFLPAAVLPDLTPEQKAAMSLPARTRSLPAQQLKSRKRKYDEYERKND